MFNPDELIFLAPEHGATDFSEGGFGRRVWVLVRSEPSRQVSNRDFLSKVLAAVQLNLEKDTLFAEIPVSLPLHFSTDLKNKTPEQVLVFGLPPAQLGLNIQAPLYFPVSFYGVTWLFADALEVLEPDKPGKGNCGLP